MKLDARLKMGNFNKIWGSFFKEGGRRSFAVKCFTTVMKIEYKHQILNVLVTSCK
jgi:hypothetical protein